jgi:hypothetical protein
MLRPQRPQKREFCGNGAAQRGHGYVAGASPALTSENEPPPQRPQNRTPSANREPQLVHATIPGMTLDGGDPLLLDPSDGDG